ncbi:MAG: phosphotransferase, partial [Anaerolineales bacterium]|nr:phosphotransferase [Anaerolineales bacterium]
MKPYQELTLSGKLRRLSQLARQALKQYDLPIGRCYLLNRSTNLIYAVYTTTGQRYILRLATPGWRTLSDLRSEAMWLQALRQETEIPVPEVILSAEGEAVVTVSAAEVPQPHQATLMSWLPGVHLGHRLTPQNLLAMGELFAQLHLHGKEWQPPAGFTTRQFTRFISRGEPEELLPKLASRGVATTELDTLQTVMADVNGVYQALDPADMRVIHCDLWHDNIKLY